MINPATPAVLPVNRPGPPPAMSAADVAAHEAASYVRPAADPGRDDVPALPPIPGPSAAPRTVASYERPDVRRVISALWNY